VAVGNAIYPLWKQALMQEVPADKTLDQGGIDPVKGVYVSLVDITVGGYIYSEGHQFYSSVTGVQGTPQLLTSAAVNGRIFSADSVVFTNVTGTQVGGIVLTRQNAGAASTWRLVLYEDTGIVGLPLVPSGGNIMVEWNTQGIFGL
jgi:hypothetical protein